MFISPEIEMLYNERFARYVTAMNGGAPDRVPIRFFLQEVAAKHCGYTNQQVGCDYNLAFEATRKMGVDVRADAVMLNAIWSNYGVGKSLGLKYLYVPGVDVSINSVLQYGEPQREEDAFLRGEEYDEFSSDPTAFLYNKWLSRASGRVNETGLPVTGEHNVALITGSMAYANYMNAFGPAYARLTEESGVVSANAGMIKAPFDILADKFRGYVDLAIDTIKQPKAVLRACEALMPHIVANALGAADGSKQVPITLWAHRGCIPFISMGTFYNIYWATLKPVIEEITAKGYQVLFYGEGNWEPHYDALLTMPVNSLIYHLDRGSYEQAARLKAKFAVSGGLRYDLLTRGSTADVRANCKELFDVLGKDGGYILDASALMLSDVKSENLRAAADYAMEHGVYSQGHAARKKYTADVPSVSENPGATPPNACRTWAVESTSYRALSGAVDLVKNSWQAVDAAAYNFLWTTVLW